MSIVHRRPGASMTAFLGVVGLVTLAAITPGPNNLIVLRAAARDGLAGAMPAIAGIVTGGLAVLAIAVIAATAALATEPFLHVVVGLAGAGYLAWLGIGLIRDAGRPRSASPDAPRLRDRRCWVCSRSSSSTPSAGR
jgi:threonine/homoserine/homoserine lactone efflux protein